MTNAVLERRSPTSERPASRHRLQRIAAPEPFLHRVLGPAWPLKGLLLGFPIWWALGMASFAFLVAAAAMAVQLVRWGRIRVPFGFGTWLTFLAWMLIGGVLIFSHAPGTLDDGGAERLVGFAYRTLWYLAITVAMLYTANLPRRVSDLAVIRWMAFLFVVAVVGGLAGLAFPRFEFTSLAELILPGADSGFIYQKVHPSLTTMSEFLGYEQPRPKAPFTYANAWGNNTGLLLPFFIYAWLRLKSVTARLAGGLLGVAALVPITYSLNRGLWGGLAVLVLYGAIVLARQRHFVLLWSLSALLAIGATVAALSPIGETVALRLNTPHSNERRGTVAETVIDTTWAASPMLGYGTNRQVAGSFSSVAGGESADCHNCAAPPLGTQGFMWRLIFTTGFVGTALFGVFGALQLLRHIRRKEPAAVLGCMSLVLSALFFFVYDSLESPLFMTMLAVGLMNRARWRTEGRKLSSGRGLWAADDDPTLRLMPAAKWFAVAGAVLGLLAGTAFYLTSPQTWTAKAALELPAAAPAVDLNPTGSRIDAQTLDTAAQLVDSDTVVDAISADQKRPVPAVRRSLSVGARQLTRVLEISYTALSDKDALDGANLAATQLIKLRQESVIDPQLAYLTAIETQTRSAVTDAALGPREIQIEPAREALRRRAFATSLALPEAGVVLDKAHLTSIAFRGDPEVPLASGLAGGALIGLLVGMVAVRRRLGLSYLVPSPRSGRPRRRARWRRIIAGTVVLGLLGGAAGVAAALTVVQPAYTAKVSVLVPPLPGNAFAVRTGRASQSLDLATEAQVARSDAVLTAVSDTVDVSLDQLRQSIRASVAPRSNVIILTVNASSPEQARSIAEQVGQRFVAEREARSQRASQALKNLLDTAISSTESALTAATVAGGNPEAVPTYNRRLTALREEYRAVTAANPQGGAVLAVVQASNTSYRLEQAAVAGAGLMLGGLLALATHGGTVLVPARPARRRSRR